MQGVAIGVRRYLKDLHDPKDEPECEHPVDWSFDNALQPTKRAIQLAIYGVREHGWPHQLKAHVLGGCSKSLQGAIHSASNKQHGVFSGILSEDMEL